MLRSEASGCGHGKFCKYRSNIHQLNENLASEPVFQMTVQVNGQSVSHSFAFNRKQLHQLCEDLLQGTMGIVDHALEKAKLTPDKVDQIVSFLI